MKRAALWTLGLVVLASVVYRVVTYEDRRAPR